MSARQDAQDAKDSLSRACNALVDVQRDMNNASYFLNRLLPQNQGEALAELCINIGVLQVEKDNAHNVLDSMDVPRKNSAGVVLTVAGRLELLREKEA